MEVFMNNIIKSNLIINLTPTGMIPTKDMTPYVPISPNEIIKDVCACYSLGINIVHLHARDEKGAPTYKREVYKKIIIGIREKCPNLVLAVSTSGRDFPEFEKRSQVLDLKGDAKPDMASLTLSSLNFNKTASINSPDTIQKLAYKMLENNIKPELEVFSLGMVNYAYYLEKKELIKPPYYFNIILGNIASAQAKPLHFGLIQSEIPNDSLVTVGGVGDFQQNMNLMGMIFANGVRVGLEDNIYYDQKRTKLATNKGLVKRVISHAKHLNLKIASKQQVRMLLSI